MFYIDPANNRTKVSSAATGRSVETVAQLRKIDKALDERRILKDLVKAIHEFRDIARQKKETAQEITRRSDRKSLSEKLGNRYMELKNLEEDQFHRVMELMSSLSDETLRKIVSFIEEKFIGLDDNQK